MIKNTLTCPTAYLFVEKLKENIEQKSLNSVFSIFYDRLFVDFTPFFKKI